MYKVALFVYDSSKFDYNGGQSIFDIESLPSDPTDYLANKITEAFPHLKIISADTEKVSSKKVISYQKFYVDSITKDVSVNAYIMNS